MVSRSSTELQADAAALSAAEAALRRVRDPERLGTLRRLKLLDSPAEEVFDRISRLASRLLGAPIALVSLVDANRQFFKSAVGLPEPYSRWRETPLSASFCKHVVGSSEPLVLDDAREDPVHRLNEAIRDLGAVAYLGCPLETVDHQVLGSFCVIHTEPHHWTEEEISIVNDLAQSVMTEIELRAASAELAASLRVRDKVLAIVSHDLRSPLQTIVTSAALLELDAADDEEREHIESIRDASARMRRLIGDLLDATTLELGSLAVEPRPLDLAALLEEVTSSLSTRAESADLDLVCRVAELPRVRADRDRITQVLVNLADNALRFTPAGGVVEIAAEPGAGEVVVSVSDNGPGVSREALEHIFDWYWHSAGSEKGGTGLGLAIARGIVEAHDGRIRAENRDGGGARFSFTLPLAS